MNSYKTPYKYELINKLNIMNVPSTVHLKDNKNYEFFVRYLLQKAMSVFKFTMPKHWDLEYFLYVLFCSGFICVFETKEFGVIPQWCTLEGLNVFYEPKIANVANPALPQIKKLEIGKDCVIIKLTPDYMGILDIISKYAAQMALCTEAFETNTYNTKFAYVFAAKDKSAARSFQEMFDRISAGEPAVAVGDKLFDEMNKPLWQPFAQNVSSTYIAPEILTTLKRCEANFDTEIGIPNANTDKRERLISDEVNANNVETYSKASLWMDFIKLGFDEVNAKFGLNLRVEWRIQPDIERSADNATADINIDPVQSKQ